MLEETKYTDGYSPLQEKSFVLALRIVKLYQYLTTEKKEYILSKQVLRSGTNPGAMIHESKGSESALDFIHKLSVALKETGETQYWLKLLFHSGYLTEIEFNSILADTVEIGKMLTSSIKTKKKNIAIKATPIILILITLLFYAF
jgi:four helix bundle protein